MTLRESRQIKKFINPLDYITVFADASFCPDTRAYGWCYWIKYDEGRSVVESGGGTNIVSAEHAEIEGLKQAIKEVKRMVFFDKIIVIQCDCTGALRKIEHLVQGFLGMGARKAYTKHVKGHRGYADARSSVNTLCDRKAREQMLKYRKLVRASQADINNVLGELDV